MTEKELRDQATTIRTTLTKLAKCADKINNNMNDIRKYLQDVGSKTAISLSNSVSSNIQTIENAQTSFDTCFKILAHCIDDHVDKTENWGHEIEDTLTDSNSFFHGITEPLQQSGGRYDWYK